MAELQSDCPVQISSTTRVLSGMVTRIDVWIWILFCMVLLTILVPHYPHTMRQNDSAAAGALRRLHQKQIEFAAAHPNSGFACSMQELKESNVRSGFKFQLSCVGSQNSSQYTLSAAPLQAGRTGFQAYCMSDAGILWFDKEGSGAACLANKHELR